MIEALSDALLRNNSLIVLIVFFVSNYVSKESNYVKNIWRFSWFEKKDP